MSRMSKRHSLDLDYESDRSDVSVLETLVRLNLNHPLAFNIYQATK